MQNENSPKQPPKVSDDSLQSPNPPGQVYSETPEVAELVNDDNKNNTEEDAMNENELTKQAEKVQDYDWNNGKPEVTPEEVETLDSHKTPEIKNDQDLRENKGEKPGEESFEASEEVNTGQNAG